MAHPFSYPDLFTGMYTGRYIGESRVLFCLVFFPRFGVFINGCFYQVNEV